MQKETKSRREQYNETLKCTAKVKYKYDVQSLWGLHERATYERASSVTLGHGLSHCGAQGAYHWLSASRDWQN